jgi:hypothetical protein
MRLAPRVLSTSKDQLKEAQHHEQADDEDDQDDPSDRFQHEIPSSMKALGSRTGR